MTVPPRIARAVNADPDGTTGKPMTPKNSYAKEELVACGHGELFGPGNAQLPTDIMLMLDRISHISSEGGEYGKGEIVAELDINPFVVREFGNAPVVVDARMILSDVEIK